MGVCECVIVVGMVVRRGKHDMRGQKKIGKSKNRC